MYYNMQVHSAYDLLNSTIKYESLFSKLAKDNQKSVVIVDPNMYGAIKAHKASKKARINLIQGLEVNLGYGIGLLKFNLLCKTEKMFYKLLEISTKLMNGEEWTVEDFSSDMIDYREDFVLIVVDELRDSMEFSYLKNDNIVYTKPSFYLNKEHYQQVIVSRAIRDNKKLNIQELTTISGEDFVREQKDFEEILALGDEELYAIFEKSFANQKLIIDSCKYELNFSGYHLPKYIYGEKEEIFEKLSSKEYLHYLVQKGVKEKLIGKDLYQYQKRYSYELKIIDEMGFNDYFLIVHDFVKYAKDNGILVGAGRGSAAGSLVCYLEH